MNDYDIKMNLYHLLKKYQLTISTAESCTGGMVASCLVDIPGISEFFEEGYITYSENAKEQLLQVNRRTIEEFGVVSEQTAREMAIGAAHKANALCAIATTGVAGPTGGTSQTPVGSVCFGCYIKEYFFSEKVIFSGTRKEIRTQAAIEAIRFITEKIEEVMK